MDVVGFATLVVGGFTACAEFGSYAFVHPVIRRLSPAHHIEVEQGLLRTFGRVMPPVMTATLALGIASASITGGQGGPPGWRWGAAGAWIAALTSTVIFNVPVGASGPLGRAITQAALEAGHQVTAFVRSPGRLGSHVRLREATGDVLDASSVAAAVPGHDAVISALGQARPSPAGHDLHPGTAHIIAAMNAARVSKPADLDLQPRRR